MPEQFVRLQRREVTDAGAGEKHQRVMDGDSIARSGDCGYIFTGVLVSR